jgi:hypothetical protein
VSVCVECNALLLLWFWFCTCVSIVLLVLQVFQFLCVSEVTQLTQLISTSKMVNEIKLIPNLFLIRLSGSYIAMCLFCGIAFLCCIVCEETFNPAHLRLKWSMK